MFVRFYILCLSLICFGSAYSQSKPFHLTFIKGLPNNHIFASAQTADGLLWLGSENGLYRYNGYQFELFNEAPKGPTRLTSSHITSLLADDHLLWIGTANGLNCLDLHNGQVRSWLVHQKAAITSLSKTKQGTILAGDANGNVYIQSGSNFRLLLCLTLYPAAKPAVGNMIVTDSNIAWVVQENNVSRLNIATGEIDWQYRAAGPALPVHIFSALYTNDTHLVLFHKNDVTILNTKTLAFENIPFWKKLAKQYKSIFAINLNSDVAWMIDEQLHFFAVDLLTNKVAPINVWNTIDPGAYLPYYAFSFNQKELWLCTSGGLLRLTRSHSFLHSFNLQSPVNPQVGVTTRAFFPGSKGLYVASYQSAIWLDTITGVARSFSKPVFAPAQTVPATGGWLYVASEYAGLCRYHPATEKVESEFYNNPHHITIREGLSLLQLDDDRLLVGAGSGLYVYSIKTNTLNAPEYHNTLNRFPAKRVFAMELAPDGNIWLATEQGLFCMNSHLQVIRQYNHTTNPLPRSSNVRCLFISRDNKVVAGTFGGGMQIIDPAANTITAFTSLHGLPDDIIYSMVPENDSVCWLGTGHGLSRFNFRSLTCNNYYRRNGLINEEFNTHSAWRAPDGTIYMGVMNGVVYFNPSFIDNSKGNVQIFLTGLLQSGRNDTVQRFGFPTHQTITLTPSDKLLQFEFALSDITAPDENRFQYKIEGLDKEWNYIGSQNTLRIYNLPAGRFTLRIRGMAPDGSVTLNDITVPLRVIPLFYKTVWFYLLLMAAVSTALWLFYRYRIRQLKKILQLRNKIARDLHDDIGATLSGISILSSITQKEVTGNPTLAQQQLQQIGTDAREMLHNMSDIIWSVNPQNDRLEHTFVRMRQFVAHTLEAQNTEVQIRFDEKLETLTLPMEARRNLYLIFKESINNIIKYAHATQVLIVLEQKEGWLQLLVKDNGKGFDLNQETRGNGLKNIQQRAGDIGATVTIDTAPGNGATIMLRLPVP